MDVLSYVLSEHLEQLHKYVLKMSLKQF